MGATEGSVCTACPAGTWSGIAGSRDLSLCINCAPGTWSSALGASEQASCRACGAGRYSAAWGAEDEGTCEQCPEGTYQPAVGQANVTNCLPCPPTKYGPLRGVDKCFTCPAGTWNDEFKLTACKRCSAGTWNAVPGSRLESDCSQCSGGSCLPDNSARISLTLMGLEACELTPAERAELAAAIAQDIASASGVAAASVVDLYGRPATVAIEGEDVGAFFVDVADKSANELAAGLYGDDFRELLANTTGRACASPVALGAVSVEPEHFEALVLTTTVSSRTETTTSLTVTTATVTETITTSMESSGAAGGLRSLGTLAAALAAAWLLR
eukprot:SRR837773.1254.p2 GENE.SRR837773.1254~~SRR837773.1254.p2  ORF type:complete len:382 (-),score=119.49 SRR837773.1254:212-1195(-)